MKIPWKKLSSEVIYQNKWYSIRKDKVIKPDGKEGEYNVLTKTAAVFIVGLNESEEVVLVNNYRYPTEMFSIEVPAGGTENEEPVKAAQREFEEETGKVAEDWKLLGEFQMANGISSQMGYVYLAQELSDGKTNSQAEEGISGTQLASFPKLFEMIANGEISDAQSIAAITIAAIYKGIFK